MRKSKPAKKTARVAKSTPKPGTSRESADARRAKFVEALIVNGENITKAGVAAGFSPKTAASQGSRLLKDVKTQELLRRRRAELQVKLELTTENVLRSLAQAVHFDPRKLFKKDGTALLPHELDDDTAAAVNGMEVEILGGKVIGMKVKAVEKNAARDQAMKHLGLFKADNVQRNPLDGLPRETLKAIAERLRGQA